MHSVSPSFRASVCHAKVMVVVDGQYLADKVAAELNPFGYAFSVTNAPDWGFRSYLHRLTNWPVFLVTSDVFSGQPFFRMDAVFLFKYEPEGKELLVLERQMAFSRCSVSAVSVPPTYRGLAALAKAYTFFELCCPVRI